MNTGTQGVMDSLAGIIGAQGFLRPWALLLILLPLLGLALDRLRLVVPPILRIPGSRAAYADAALRPWSERARVPRWQQTLRRGLSALAWAWLCVALAGPWRQAASTTEAAATGQQGKHLLLLIPRCGGSDAVLRQALQDAIGALDGADASLIVYAGSAALLLPATHDPALLRGALQQLDTPRLSGLGCDPRSAGALAEREQRRWLALGGADAQAVLTVAGTGIDTDGDVLPQTDAIAPSALAAAVRRSLRALPQASRPSLQIQTMTTLPLLLGLLLGALALSPWPRRAPAPLAALLIVLSGALPVQRLEAAEPATAPWSRDWQSGLQALADDDPLLALPALQRAWLLAPPGRLQWQALYNLGLAHARLGDWQAALDAWSRVALALPGDPATQHNLHVARRALAQQRLREGDELRGRHGLGTTGEIQTDSAGDANLKAFLDDAQTTREGAAGSGAGSAVTAAPAAQTQPAAYRAPDAATLSSALRKQQMLENRPERLYHALQRSDRQHAADDATAHPGTRQ